jgi:hypothetical protein
MRAVSKFGVTAAVGWPVDTPKMCADTDPPLSAELLRGTYLAAYPVAAVLVNLAVPSQVQQPVLQRVWVDRILHDPERPAIFQPPFDDLVGVRDPGFLLAFDVLVDEQHPSVLGQQAPQYPP